MYIDDSTQRIREMVSTIFDVPLELVTPESSSDDFEQWDSLGRLVLVVQLEQEFAVELPPEQVERLTSIAAIVEILGELDVWISRAEAS